MRPGRRHRYGAGGVIDAIFEDSYPGDASGFEIRSSEWGSGPYLKGGQGIKVQLYLSRMRATAGG